MLYQTHHPNFFQFHTFTSILTSAATATSFLSIYPSSSSVLQEMECIEAAFKTSCWRELSLKLNTQAVLDDIGAANFLNGAPSDDTFVDEFLDFSNEDGLAEQQEPRDEEQKKLSVSVSLKQEQQRGADDNSEECLNFDELGPIPATELDVPVGELENLEWLSHFVEDSFSVHSTPFPAVTLPAKPKENESEAKTPALASPCFKTPVPAKARSKRTRSGGRVWSLGSPSLSDSSSTSPTSSSASLNSLEPALPFPSEKPPKKKQKKISLTEEFKEGGDGSSGSLCVRRCSHCGVQKTPQWRAGPLGSKTLCNACGVRYKSGRLYPEYRPACSPTFSSDRHSNHHRKVLEMRRKKELLGPGEPGLAAAAVPTF